MESIIKQNLLKNIILIILFIAVYFPVQSYLLNSNLVADTAAAGDILVAVSIIAVIACFGNFAFTYEKIKADNRIHLFFAHFTTGLLMLIIGISLIFTSILISIIMGYYILVDFLLLALYVACVGYDFWDLFRTNINVR